MVRFIKTKVTRGEPLLASDINDLTFFPKGTILTFSSTAWIATSAEFKTIWKICNATNHAVDDFIPDLTNKFLRGAESSGAAGGADSQNVTLQTTNLPSHNHGATGLSVSGMSLTGLSCSEGGSHKHTLSGETTSVGHSHSITDPGHDHRIGYYGRGGSSGNYTMTDTRVSEMRTSQETTGISISGDGTHTHSFSSTSEAVAVVGHSHTVTGSITGGSISGSTDNTGSSTAFSVNTVPSYYAVIYIIKIV